MKENTDNNGIQIHTDIVKKSRVCLNKAAKWCHDPEDQ